MAISPEDVHRLLRQVEQAVSRSRRLVAESAALLRWRRPFVPFAKLVETREALAGTTRLRTDVEADLRRNPYVVGVWPPDEDEPR